MDADNDFPLMAQDHYYQHLALYGIMEQGITDNRLRLADEEAKGGDFSMAICSSWIWIPVSLLIPYLEVLRLKSLFICSGLY